MQVEFREDAAGHVTLLTRANMSMPPRIGERVWAFIESTGEDKEFEVVKVLYVMGKVQDDPPYAVAYLKGV